MWERRYEWVYKYKEIPWKKTRWVLLQSESSYCERKLKNIYNQIQKEHLKEDSTTLRACSVWEGERWDVILQRKMSFVVMKWIHWYKEHVNEFERTFMTISQVGMIYMYTYFSKQTWIFSKKRLIWRHVGTNVLKLTKIQNHIYNQMLLLKE